MSHRKIITERDIRKAIKVEGNTLVFAMQINKHRIHETQNTLDKELAFQKVTHKWFRNGRFQPEVNKRVSELPAIVAEAKKDKSAKYLDDIERSLKILVRYIGDKQARDVTESDSTDFRTALFSLKKRNGEPIKSHRINGIMTMCQSAFHVAERRGIIPKGSNPFKDFERVTQIDPPIITFNRKEFHAYRDKGVEIYGGDYGLQLDLYLLTGMRDSEWCNVEWDWIVWDSSLLIIPGEHTKNGKPRKIPLTKTAVRNLQILKEHGHTSPVDVSSEEISHRWRHCRTGRRTNRKTFVGTNIPGTFHSLRKTTRTELVGIGLHPELLNGLFGHLPKSVGEEFYLNYDRNIPVVRRALERLSKLFGL